MTKLLLFSKNVPLYNDYQNPIRFKSIEERSTFFAKYDSRYKNVEFWKNLTSRNITYGNGLNMSVVIPLDSGVGYPENIEGLPQKLEPNYLCIREIYADGTSQENIDKFYFINNLTLVNSKAIRVDCELDVMTTFIYGIHYQINGKVFAERKHCNRFYLKSNMWKYNIHDTLLIDDIENTINADVSENYIETVPSYEVVDDVTNNYLKDKKFLLIISAEPLDKENNVDAQGVDKLKIENGTGVTLSTSLYYSLVPLFDYWHENIQVSPSINVNKLINNFNETSNIINAVVIPYCIINNIQSANFYYDATNSKFIINTPTPNNEYAYHKYGQDCGFIKLLTINSTFQLSKKFNINENLIPSQDYSTLVDRDIKYEPKLHKMPYRKLSLYANDKSYDYDKLLLNTEEGSIQTYIIPSASTTQAMSFIRGVRTKDIDDKYKTPYENEIYKGVGCMNSLNKGINLLNDKWQQFVTQNKNWQYLQDIEVGQTALKALTSLSLMAFGGATGNPLLMVGGGVSSVSTAINTALTGERQRLQNENIQAQPNELKNLSNDVYFSHMVYEVEYPRLILYKANDTLMQKAYDFYFNFGYKYNQDIFFTEFFNRQRFNYIKINDDIKCRVQTLTFNGDKYQMNANIIKKLNSIFNNGTTLWNVCDEQFNTEYENWEVSLSE